MSQVLAVRNGGASWLIPDDFRQKFLAQGFRLLPCPPSTPSVSKPTELEKVEVVAAPIAPAPKAGGAASTSPKKRRRGRPKGAKTRRGAG